MWQREADLGFALVLAEGADGVDAAGAARGEETCQQGSRDQDEKWVLRRQPEK
jgi:hypothetical protein